MLLRCMFIFMDNRLLEKSRMVRKTAFEMAVSGGKGHLGGAFSSVEILVALYYGEVFRLRPAGRDNCAIDRFIFSKGHACLAFYPILADLGFFSSDLLETYGKNGSVFGGHPDHLINGVEISTGSLGHGLSVGCGLALAAKKDKKESFTVVLLGDGECNEGSVWEAANFGSAQGLNNLVAIIDNNKIGATDFVSKFAGGAKMSEKWQSFGWTTEVVDGHDFDKLLEAYKNAYTNTLGRPYAIIAETTKGKGVSFMENRPEWHHGIPRDEMLALARKELEEQRLNT